MTKFKFVALIQKLAGDLITPVSAYYKIRDEFPMSVLLESSDYHHNKNAYSYIFFNPIGGFKVEDNEMKLNFPNGIKTNKPINDQSLMQEINKFSNSFEVSSTSTKFFNKGLVGYFSYDSIPHFEQIKFNKDKPSKNNIPQVMLTFYQYMIVFNHYNNEINLVGYLHEDENKEHFIEKLQQIKQILINKKITQFSFKTKGDEEKNMEDSQYLDIVKAAKQNIKKGEVFQLVVARKFRQNFTGDDFNVYRSLRIINPSPYLFYFDYGSFKIFGSSPEAQVEIKNNSASIYPIAGTLKRDESHESDMQIAEQLLNDEKENAEHVMLVDLARNDLGKSCDEVEVETFKEVQYYSHVVHLVSKVTGKVPNEITPEQLIVDSFPAGTLSGAPKYRAMQIIDELEPDKRCFYGGCIGVIGLNDKTNNHHQTSQAIMIRTFLSKNNQLEFQAGAGIVDDSIPDNELKEVDNKLRALRKAIVKAETINGEE